MCDPPTRRPEVVSGLLWPLTRTVLERITAGYEAEAEREDQSAGANAHRGARLQEVISIALVRRLTSGYSNQKPGSRSAVRCSNALVSVTRQKGQTVQTTVVSNFLEGPRPKISARMALGAASPADCSHSVTITMRTAMPISRIKAIAQEQSSVNGDLATFTRFIFG
jgi:hypothetical protein